MNEEALSRVSPPARGGVRGGGSGVQPTHPTQPPLEKGRSMLLVFSTIIVIIAGAFLFLHPRSCANFRQATLQTPTQTIFLAVAQTSEQQSRGLGGCRYIPKNAGMYFPFHSAQNTIFWMKNMLIPIDIIWIKDGQVVGIEKNVPNEPADTPGTKLTTYPSPGEIDAVLEIEAGKAEEYGIAQDSQLNLTQGK